MRPVLAVAFCLGLVVLGAKSPAATMLPDKPGAHEQGGVLDARFGIIYTRNRQFDLPFNVEVPVRAVVLHVSTDNGKTYRQAGSATPNTDRFKNRFPFQAPRDGMYWFSVQTVDAQGKREPAKVQDQPPGLKVCVDTKAPVVQLKASRQGKEVRIEWVARDPHLRTQTMKLEYRVVGEDRWTALPAEQKATGKYTWTPENTRVEVRLRASDWAGNLGEETVTVTRKRPKQ